MCNVENVTAYAHTQGDIMKIIDSELQKRGYIVVTGMLVTDGTAWSHNRAIIQITGQRIATHSPSIQEGQYQRSLGLQYRSD